MAAPVWLIASAVYGPEVEPLAAEVHRQGLECRFVTYREIVKGPAPLAPGACAVVYGTYPTVQHAMLRCGWSPGGWCSAEKLDCSAYYPHFAQFLLNERREILPGITAIQERNRIFSEFGSSGVVFTRPTCVHKLFVGRLISETDFETALAPTRYDPETQIVVAEPQELGREWRLVVAGDRVVGASQYADQGRKSVAPGCPDGVREFAAAMLHDVRWRPDELFMLDVCETWRGFRLVELNSFSCSWLYACDFAPVVATASLAASQAWERSQTT